MIRRASKVDGNQKDLVAFMRAHKAKVFHTHIVKKFCDVVVCFRGTIFLVEIKNKQDLPQKFFRMNKIKQREYLEGMLTDGEGGAKDSIESVDVPYWIIYNRQSALDMLMSV